MSEVIYRTATADDIEDILEVVRIGWPPGTPELLEQRHGIIGGKQWLERQLAPVRSSVESNLDTTIVAEIDGCVAGWAVYTLDQATETGAIDYNAVHPDFRGRGIGSELVQQALDKLREAGMRIAMAGTGLGDDHAPARRVYEKLGFRPLRESVQYSMEL